MKTQYRTKQRDILLSYLKKVPGQHVTAGDLSEHMRSRGEPIGMTTIYRHLERLVGEGLVNKYFIDENSSACFEYIDPENDCHHPVCYHCRCEACGKLFHVECEEIGHLSEHLKEDHGFTIDPFRTVFYGVCKACRKEDDGASAAGNREISPASGNET